MEVRVVWFDNDESCPFSGSGTVIVLEYSPTQARLLHPTTLQEWTVPIDDQYNQQGVIDRYGIRNATKPEDLLWPVNQSPFKLSVENLVNLIRQRAQWHWLYTRDFNLSTIVTVLSELGSLPEDEVRRDLEALRASTQPVARSRGKGPGTGGGQTTIGGSMATETAKASGHRAGVKYQTTDKLDAEKFRGQKACVAKALGAYSTPKTLEEIVRKVEANGGYSVKAAGGITDSVHYHLRVLVKDGLITELVPPAPAEEPKAAKATKAKPEAKPELVNA